MPVRSELWIHGQLCPSRGSQVGHNADKGAQELSFKGSIERTAMDATCCKLKRVPACLRNGLCCAGVEEDPHGAKEREVLRGKGSWPLW